VLFRKDAWCEEHGGLRVEKSRLACMFSSSARVLHSASRQQGEHLSLPSTSHQLIFFFHSITLYCLRPAVTRSVYVDHAMHVCAMLQYATDRMDSLYYCLNSLVDLLRTAWSSRGPSHQLFGGVTDVILMMRREGVGVGYRCFNRSSFTGHSWSHPTSPCEKSRKLDA
jgi:hypothetical protein